MVGIDEKIHEVLSGLLKANGIGVLQMNLGYRCNMACKHCHIEAGPHRTELMGREIMDAALRAAGEFSINTIDLTGGAPELNPSFRYLVREARKAGCHVIVRSNLTIVFEDGMEDLPEFYSENGVELVASLPHYTEATSDRVRGPGAFSKSIEALRKLNGLGYGTADGKPISLVYNPQGAFLPGCQAELEGHYRKELLASYGIVFSHLYTFANMPIGRFRDFLVRTNNFNQYGEKIRNAFNPATLSGLMCRHLICVGWDGKLYDCDFNQALGLTIDNGCPSHIKDFDYATLAKRNIVMGNHCFVCMAGQGST